MKRQLIATTTFGLEAVVKREIQGLGYEIIRTEDGKVTFSGDDKAIPKSNIWLRCADRVLLKVGEFKAADFETLFQRVQGLPWEEIIPADGSFVVSGTSVKSQLTSVPACQRTIKKAVVNRLRDFYRSELHETGSEYPIRFTLLKDVLTISIDTTGEGLHKRGYRQEQGRAPIKETLAAAMVSLSFWNAGRILVDPCCGSGTIAIEAAMIGRNIAPGLGRNFISESWDIIESSAWQEEKKLAYESIDYDTEINIYASDVDGRALMMAESNAHMAGVADDIVFKKSNIGRLKLPGQSSVIITNPPYGERMGEVQEIKEIYRALNRFMKEDPTVSIFIITTDKGLERQVADRPADRRRKLYNGRLETTYYQFHGQKPD